MPSVTESLSLLSWAIMWHNPHRWALHPARAPGLPLNSWKHEFLEMLSEYTKIVNSVNSSWAGIAQGFCWYSEPFICINVFIENTIASMKNQRFVWNIKWNREKKKREFNKSEPSGVMFFSLVLIKIYHLKLYPLFHMCLILDMFELFVCIALRRILKL